MAKGFIKYETRELEFLTIATAYTNKSMHSARVYLPKRFAGRRVIIAVPSDHQGGDHSE